MTREILENLFGEGVMKALGDFQRSRVERRKSLRRAATVDSSGGGGDGSKNDTFVVEHDEDMDVLCGTEDSPGKLQVGVWVHLSSTVQYSRSFHVTCEV